MKFTVWQHKPEPVSMWDSRIVTDEGFKFMAVCWTDNEDGERECRTVTITVEVDGTTTVEHGTSEERDWPTVESITRITMPGWDNT